jgi:hypothetical protein
MKTQIAILFFLFATTLLYAQDNICNSAYAPFREGAKMEYTTYDKKGKAAAISQQEIETIDDIEGGFEANVRYSLKNEKQEEISRGVYALQCKGDEIWMDLSNLLNSSMLEGFKDMEFEVENEKMDLPNKPTVGQQLKDGAITMKAMMNGTAIMNFRARVYDRKVEKMEKITTSAGTFDCIKITETTEVKMGLKRSSPSATWYAVGVGMVKTESYNKKGELESSTVLTKFSK